MAVYTQLTDEEIASLLTQYDIGPLVSAKGIAEGIENTNFLIEAGEPVKRYVLTIYEGRISAKDLPFFFNLTEFLGERGVPCPRAIKSKSGGTVMQIKGKPASIIHFLEGQNNPEMTPKHIEQVGALSARLQLLAKDFKYARRNSLSLDKWKQMFEGFRARANEITPNLEQDIAGELEFLSAHWPKDLPSGIIHADLFPDNIFFKASKDGKPEVSGVIDFYFACNDFWMYDLLICMNAWCFDAQYHFLRERAQALLFAYTETRTINLPERRAMPVLARAAAVRFLITRSHDWLNRVEGALVTAKDPLEYLAKLRFHREVHDYREYGLL